MKTLQALYSSQMLPLSKFLMQEWEKTGEISEMVLKSRVIRNDILEKTPLDIDHKRAIASFMFVDKMRDLPYFSLSYRESLRVISNFERITKERIPNSEVFRLYLEFMPGFWQNEKVPEKEIQVFEALRTCFGDKPKSVECSTFGSLMRGIKTMIHIGTVLKETTDNSTLDPIKTAEQGFGPIIALDKNKENAVFLSTKTGISTGISSFKLYKIDHVSDNRNLIYPILVFANKGITHHVEKYVFDNNYWANLSDLEGNTQNSLFWKEVMGRKSHQFVKA